jgi:hypothetical protein
MVVAFHLNNKKKEKKKGGQRHAPGFGSGSKEEIESRTREIVKAGDHCSFKISKQMLPFLLICGLTTNCDVNLAKAPRKEQWEPTYVWVVNFSLKGNLHVSQASEMLYHASKHQSPVLHIGNSLLKNGIRVQTLGGLKG